LELLEKRMARGDHFTGEKGEQLRKMFANRVIRLIPVTEIHFSKMGEGNPTTTLSLLFVGLIALIIAYINFVNFSVAMAPARIKSLNIQKIFGAQNGLLRFIVASESAVFSLIAFLLSIVCADMIYGNSSMDFVFADLSLANNLPILAVAGVFTVLLGFAAGLYPAYYITSSKPALVLSGSPAKSKKNAGMRNVLTSIQFTVAIALITVIVFMKQQHSYAVNYSYGIDREHVAYLSTLYWDDDNLRNPESVRAFAGELKNSPQISDYAATSILMGQGWGDRSMSMTLQDVKFD
jgi:putative ABC transport system permease protein